MQPKFIVDTVNVEKPLFSKSSNSTISFYTMMTIIDDDV